MARHAILQTFYASRKWRQFRTALILERGNRCQQCKKLVAKSGELVGHHLTELTPDIVGDFAISLNPEKVQLLCRGCHDQEHQRFGYQGNAYKKVYIVYGSPLAGKSTHVLQQMRRGDIIVDIDRLYEALSGLPCYDKPDNLFKNVIGVQKHVIDHIKTRFGKWHNAWLIGGYAERHKRERLAEELGAELVFMDAMKEECVARLEMDEDRRLFRGEWKGYIDKWFEEYQE